MRRFVVLMVLGAGCLAGQGDYDGLPELGEEAVEQDPDELPDRLTLDQVKQAVVPHMARFLECAQEFGAPSGAKVRLKFHVEGATGRVDGCVAASPYDGSDLGDCVVSVMEAVVFPRFRKDRMGVIYPIRLE